MIWFSFCVTFAEFISPLRLPKTEAGQEGNCLQMPLLLQLFTKAERYVFFLYVCFPSTIDSKIAIRRGKSGGSQLFGQQMIWSGIFHPAQKDE